MRNTVTAEDNLLLPWLDFDSARCPVGYLLTFCATARAGRDSSYVHMETVRTSGNIITVLQITDVAS